MVYRCLGWPSLTYPDSGIGGGASGEGGHGRGTGRRIDPIESPASGQGSQLGGTRIGDPQGGGLDAKVTEGHVCLFGHPTWDSWLWD